MAAKPAVVEKNRMSRDAGRLQPCSHLAGMKRVAISIGIARDEHGGRVGNAWPNLVVRRILSERIEIVGILHGPEFLAPDMGIVKQVIAEHIEHGDHADDRAKQVWPLC